MTALGVGLGLGLQQGAWAPAQLFAVGEQGGWYDPSDLSTQFQDSAGTTPVTAAGQPVGKVLDKSGRGNHLAQAIAPSRPVLTQDASGFYYWACDGVDDLLPTAATMNLSGTDKVTVFAGFYKASDTLRGMLCELGATYSNPGTFGIDAPPADAAAQIQVAANLSALTAKAIAIAAPSASVITASLIASAAAAIEFRRNGISSGVASGNSGVGNYSNATFNMGSRTGPTLPFNGRIYQMIVRGAASSATEIAAAERFIGAKMGIAL